MSHGQCDPHSHVTIRNMFKSFLSSEVSDIQI